MLSCLLQRLRFHLCSLIVGWAVCLGPDIDVGGLEVDKMVIARTSNVLRRITTLLIISCLLTVGLCVNTAAALPGSGTQADPWRIQSLADFDEFAADPIYWAYWAWPGYTRLETDVNLAGRTYTTAVIAPDVNSDPYFDGTAFTGVFDGNDHKITNLTIDGAGTRNSFVGLFGCIDEGEVRNLGLEDVFVSGDNHVGGLVGANGDWGLPGGAISNCYSTGGVVGTGWYVAGLVGKNDYDISNCCSTGSVRGSSYVGGLVGVNYATVSRCYSTGDVSGGGAVGGLVGSGGGGNISVCYSVGDVNGYSEIGGLVGSNGSWANVSNSYSTGDVNGVEDVGGLVGQNGWGNPISGDYPGYIYNSYSTGNIEGTSYVGGLVGCNVAGDIERSFWDVETSGEPNMCGGQWWATGCDPNCGKTTAEMQTKSTFTEAGWDFVEIWLINEGATYPVLRQEIRSDLNGNGGVDMLDFAIFADHWLEGTGD